MQTYTAVGITALRAILEVTFYRTTDCRQLATYLMMTTGLQVHFQERIIVAAHKGLVTQNGLFSVFGALFGNIGLVLRFVAYEPVL